MPTELKDLQPKTAQPEPNVGWTPTPEMVSAILAILMSIYQLYKTIKK